LENQRETDIWDRKMQEDDKTETDTIEITKLIKFVNSFIVSGKKK
jgi:hypothetical protein